MFKEVIEELLYRYKMRTVKNRPLIVAVDGLGGAGKTTLVKNIENELKNICTISVIHIDDYIEENNERYNTGYDEWYEYYYLQWNIEKIRDDLLKKNS
ncbi:uridine kinase [Lysinibacillus sp. NPDC096418]|uniref:uridine kinase n=1 Tax=Lysinibacillus sp. NPDC096418 TaxID=3364138 RepID=UPI00381BB7A1